MHDERSLFDRDKAFRFPMGTTLAAGQRLVVFCDEEPADGPFHAPFRLGQEGDSLVLARTGPAPTVLDSIAFGAVPTDMAFGIPSCEGHPGVLDRPTPNEPNAAAGTPFIRGDANASGSLEIGDPLQILTHLYQHAALPCDDAADANDSGTVDVADPIHVLAYLFARGPAPRLPFPGCGLDRTASDPLGCASFAPCRAAP